MGDVYIFTDQYENVYLARTIHRDTVAEAREIAHGATERNLNYVGTTDAIEPGDVMEV